MTAQMPPAQSKGASPLFLREAEIRRGIELLYFGYSHLNRAVDNRLATRGLGRAHQRALYFVARQPGLTVSDLLKLLGITKQSLGRVINDLVALDLLETMQGRADRRQKLLRLTQTGVIFEASLFDDLREKLTYAYAEAGQSAVSGFWKVLEGLIPADEIARVIALQRED
jgi:DNA-binding MarR family transcriptional regulator